MAELVKFRNADWYAEWPSVYAAYGDAFMQKFPIFDYTFDFVRNFDANEFVFSSARQWENAVIVVSFLYVIAVFGGIRIMKNREAFSLATPLKYWNLFLAVFSIWGTVRLSVMTFYTYFTSASEDAYLCAPGPFTSGNGVSGLATAMFMYSKLFELVDTLFLILRKKPVGFLHWFHHATVLVFTWDAFANQQNGAALFMAMNYFVHAVMYTYYYLAACGKPPKWGKAVTTMQIVQMVFGTYWSVRSVMLVHQYGPLLEMPASAYTAEGFTLEVVKEHGCSQVKYNAYAGLAMYAVYLYLFAEFFVKRYIFPSKKPARQPAVAKKSE